MKKKTLNKRLGAALITAFCLSSGMTAFAAPEAMPNGSIFDAEYYAKNNPDVVAALGTEKDALFNHYVMFGWNEGRLAFEGDTPRSSNLTITHEQQPQVQQPSTGYDPNNPYAGYDMTNPYTGEVMKPGEAYQTKDGVWVHAPETSADRAKRYAEMFGGTPLQ